MKPNGVICALAVPQVLCRGDGTRWRPGGGAGVSLKRIFDRNCGLHAPASPHGKPVDRTRSPYPSRFGGTSTMAIFAPQSRHEQYRMRDPSRRLREPPEQMTLVDRQRLQWRAVTKMTNCCMIGERVKVRRLLVGIKKPVRPSVRKEVTNTQTRAWTDGQDGQCFCRPFSAAALHFSHVMLRDESAAESTHIGIAAGIGDHGERIA